LSGRDFARGLRLTPIAFAAVVDTRVLRVIKERSVRLDSHPFRIYCDNRRETEDKVGANASGEFVQVSREPTGVADGKAWMEVRLHCRKADVRVLKSGRFTALARGSYAGEKKTIHLF
jgi:hypothetical protein